jgi:maltose alpha-D-glucosyltransferase/alpha-amylase
LKSSIMSIRLARDTTWLNPCFASPFGDAGYDGTDFYRVASCYGTNDDLRRLFTEAKKRGIHMMPDLVAGHTSVECRWFKFPSYARVMVKRL